MNQKGFSVITVLITILLAVAILYLLREAVIYSFHQRYQQNIKITNEIANLTTSQPQALPEGFPSFLPLYSNAQYTSQEKLEDCEEAVSPSCNDKSLNLYTTKYTFRTEDSFEEVVDWYVEDKSSTGWKLDKDGELRDENGALVFEENGLVAAKKTGYLSTGKEGQDIYWVEIKKDGDGTKINYYIPTKNEQVLLYDSSKTSGFPPYPNAKLINTEQKPACRGDEQREEQATCGSTAYTWETADDFDQVNNWYKNDSGGSGWVCAGGGGRYDGSRNAGGSTGCSKGDLNYLMSLISTTDKTEITVYVK